MLLCLFVRTRDVEFEQLWIKIWVAEILRLGLSEPYCELQGGAPLVLWKASLKGSVLRKMSAPGNGLGLFCSVCRSNLLFLCIISSLPGKLSHTVQLPQKLSNVSSPCPPAPHAHYFSIITPLTKNKKMSFYCHRLIERCCVFSFFRVYNNINEWMHYRLVASTIKLRKKRVVFVCASVTFVNFTDVLWTKFCLIKAYLSEVVKYIYSRCSTQLHYCTTYYTMSRRSVPYGFCQSLFNL